MSKENPDKFVVRGISFTIFTLAFAKSEARNSGRTLSGYIRSLIMREMNGSRR